MARTESRTHARRAARTALAAAAALAAVGMAHAQSVYKEVDADGNVTYTDQPPASDFVDAHRFELPPDLTEEQRRAAAADRDKVLREADIEGTLSTPRATPQELREAERRVREARDRLENYEIVRDDDWAGTQQGKRGLKPGYYARVDAAKKQLSEAQAELTRLRQQGR